jgi:hypothetical protein
VLATAGSVGGRENGMQACPSLGTATARCLEGRAVLLSGSRATAPLQCMLQPQRMVRLHLLSCLHSLAQPLHTPWQHALGFGRVHERVRAVAWCAGYRRHVQNLRTAINN